MCAHDLALPTSSGRPCFLQMLKFRWSLRCWETLQGKNDTRALLEEAAAAVHHLGLVPMPPSSALRQVYDDLVSHGGAIAAIGLDSSNNTNANNSSSIGNGNSSINVGGGVNPPVNPEGSQARAHSAGRADGMFHAESHGVPPVAAGVLRDLHRQGVLNGEAASMWGDGGAAAATTNPSPGADRAPPHPAPAAAPSQAPAPTPAAATAAAAAATAAAAAAAGSTGGHAGFPPSGGVGGASNPGAGTGAGVSGGAPMSASQWAPPPAPLPAATSSSHSSSTNVSSTKGAGNADVNPSGNNNPAGKRKAGAAFPDASSSSSPAVNTQW